MTVVCDGDLATKLLSTVGEESTESAASRTVVLVPFGPMALLFSFQTSANKRVSIKHENEPQ